MKQFFFTVALFCFFVFCACGRNSTTNEYEHKTVEEFVEHFESLQFLIDSPLLYQGNWQAEVTRPDERTNNFEDYVLRCFYADTLDDDSVVCRSYCNLQNIKTLKWYWDTNSVDSVILHKFWKIDTNQYHSYVNEIASMIWTIIAGYQVDKISFFEGSICVFSSYNGWGMITFRPYASQRVLNSIEHLNDCYSEEDAKYIRLDSTNYWVRKYKAK
jgi:hypothetical protein